MSEMEKIHIRIRRTLETRINGELDGRDFAKIDCHSKLACGISRKRVAVSFRGVVRMSMISRNYEVCIVCETLCKPYSMVFFNRLLDSQIKQTLSVNVFTLGTSAMFLFAYNSMFSRRELSN